MEYVSRKELENFKMSELIEFKESGKKVERMVNAFVKFAREIPGCINRTWIKRNKKTFNDLSSQYQKLEFELGKTNIERIIACNTLQLRNVEYAKQLAVYHQKIGLYTYKDIDQRYVFRESIFVFWHSLLVLIKVHSEKRSSLNQFEWIVARNTGKGKSVLVKGQVMLLSNYTIHSKKKGFLEIKSFLEI